MTKRIIGPESSKPIILIQTKQNEQQKVNESICKN